MRLQANRWLLWNRQRKQASCLLILGIWHPAKRNPAERWKHLYGQGETTKTVFNFLREFSHLVEQLHVDAKQPEDASADWVVDHVEELQLLPEISTRVDSSFDFVARISIHVQSVQIG